MTIVLRNVLQIQTIAIVAGGCFAGIILGAIPGLNGSIGVSLMLPFTFGISPVHGLLLLGGIYMGATYGGSISAILINVPGTPESYCTGLEGYPMAKNGRGKEALYLAAVSSVIGGTVGVIALIYFTPPLAAAALTFGPPEMFLVGIVGLTVVGSLAGKDMTKGIFAAAFGIFLGMMGYDNVTGAKRLDFGIPNMIMGIDLISVVLGFFSLSEMFLQIESRIFKERGEDRRVERETAKLGNISPMKVLKNVLGKPFLLIKSCLLGTVIGILPGTGGAIASFVAYGEAKRTAKGPEFGKGNPDGIMAAESANNAAVGGSLVPLLALGIPGSSTSAVMYGAMMIHGLSAGPRLFTENREIAYSFVYGMLLTVVVMGLVGILCVPLFSKVLKVDMKVLIPIVILCSLIGAYSVRNSMFDVLAAVVFGFLGVWFHKLGIPASPVVLGLILCPLIESNFRMSLTIAGAEGVSVAGYMAARPLSWCILAIGILLILANLKTMSLEMKGKNNK